MVLNVLPERLQKKNTEVAKKIADTVWECDMCDAMVPTDEVHGYPVMSGATGYVYCANCCNSGGGDSYHPEACLRCRRLDGNNN